MCVGAFSLCAHGEYLAGFSLLVPSRTWKLQPTGVFKTSSKLIPGSAQL